MLLAALSAPEAAAGYHDQTNLHPVGLLMVFLLGVATLVVPRKHAVLPTLLLACFVSPAQRLVVASLDFNLVRLMVMFAWIRLLARGEYAHLRWTTLDKLLVAWAGFGAVTYCLLHGSMGALINRLGRAYDFVGMYLFFRCVVRSWQDVDHLVRALGLLIVPVAFAFLAERLTGRNLFASMGGVPELTKVREGRLRCQGPFPHAILAGSFFVTLLPLIISGWWDRRQSKLRTGTTIGLVLLIIGLTSSATPLMGVSGGMLALVAYPFRRSLRSVRWSVAAVLITLHLVMQAPVWHLISRVDLVGGSSGYHRYMLIDRFIANFGEWMVLGVKSTEHWGPYMRDMANQYVVEGVRGGMLRLVLFLAVLGVGFREAGRVIKYARADKARHARAWALGTTLMVQVTIFFGIAISYSQQNTILFTLTLAMIAGLSQSATRQARFERMQAARAEEPQRGPRPMTDPAPAL